MQHEMSTSEELWGAILALLPLVVVGIWIFMFVDWYRHAKSRRSFWLVVILVTNIIGYLFFLRSNDRSA